MAFDEKLYFRKGATAGAVGTPSTVAFSCTSMIKISETPVAGLAINVVIPEKTSPNKGSLKVDIYEADSAAWASMVKIHTTPEYKTAGGYFERVYSDRDYLACYVTTSYCVEDSALGSFGAVDVRLTDRFAKYAGQ